MEFEPVMVILCIHDTCYLAITGRTRFVKGRLFRKGIIVHKHLFHLIAREARIFGETIAGPRHVAGLSKSVAAVFAGLVTRVDGFGVQVAERIHQAIVG